MRTLLLIAKQNLAVAARDRKSMAMSLLMPLLLVAILGTALAGAVGTGTIAPADVYVLNDDTGVEIGPETVALGRVLAEELFDSDAAAEVLRVRTVDSGGRAEALADVAAGRAAALVEIPLGFTAAALAGAPVDIAVLTDPAAPVHAGIVLQIVQSFADGLASELVAWRLTGEWATAGPADYESVGPGMPVLTTVTAGTRPVSAIQYYAVATSLMFIVMTAIMRGGLLNEEREQGTLGRMLAAPVTKAQVIAGQVLGIVAVAGLQFAILAVGTRLLFGAYWGPVGIAVLLGCVFSAAAAGIGLAAAAIIRDKKAIVMLGVAISNVMGMLSGAMMPLAMFPDGMRLAAKFTPNYWALQAFLDQMAGVVRVAGTQLWLPVAVLGGIAVATGALGAWRLAAR